MSQLAQTFKRFTPAPLWDAARGAWYGLIRASQWPAATFHPWRRQSIRQLARLKDIHAGERCFIIGNGPSLKQTDLSRLKPEYTFGVNRIYLLFPELGFSTSYYLSINSLVIEQCAADILDLPAPKFLSWRSRGLIRRALPDMDRLPESPPLAFLHTTYTGPRFASDARGRLWEGATVTYVALQLAFHMGFRQVILVGVDHSFSTQGRPNTTIVSQGDDPDHFDARYFGRGFRWQLPDLETSERGYALARRAYEQAGRQVLDATIGGKLQIFQKVDFEALF
jgi:hypothetical protein